MTWSDDMASPGHCQCSMKPGNETLCTNDMWNFLWYSEMKWYQWRNDNHEALQSMTEVMCPEMQ